MNSPDRPIASILGDIMGNVQDIIRSEARLAKTEVTQELRKSRAGAVWIVLGLGMLLLSGMFLLLGIVYALSLVMPAWAAALIVAAGEGIMAAIFIAAGVRKLKAMRGAPRTVETLKENMEWASHPTR